LGAKLKAAFFGLEDWEVNYIKKHLGSGFAASFYPQSLDEKNIHLAKDADCLGVFIYSKCDAKLLAALPKLKFICTFSTGFDHIDLDYCRKRKIAVAYVPTYGEKTVAEHTFALLLSLVRKVPSASDRVLHGDFSVTGLMGSEIYGKTLGVLGTGHIGGHVISIAKGFGMKVIAYTHHPDYSLANSLGFSYAPLDTVLSQSDFLTLHLPLLPQTHHILNSSRISKMKKGAILINTARGGLIDTKALANALITGKLGGAALDVLEEEPLIRDEREVLIKGSAHAAAVRTALINHMLLGLPNVIITPHIAFYTKEALESIADTCVGNFKAFRSGKILNRLDVAKKK
jgi:D-lactate dehydrogenase